MNDLPETLPGILRCMADMLDGPQNAGNLVVPAIIGRFRDAADTIESLEAENAVLRAQQEQPNEPLTLNELCEMDGEPVAIEEDGEYQYGLVSLSGCALAPRCEVIAVCSGDFYLISEMGEDYKVYPIAYRHQPEQEEM